MTVILGIALIYGFVHNFIPVGIMLVYPILGNDNFHRQSVATMQVKIGPRFNNKLLISFMDKNNLPGSGCSNVG